VTEHRSRSLATLAYNLKTMIHVLGGYKLVCALAN
jgi:hypothetical protein